MLTIGGKSLSIAQDGQSGPPPAPPAFSRCDVNRDGVVNSVDVDLVSNAVLNASQDPAYDINRDGMVNIVDVQIVVNAVLDPRSCPA
jgi:hypothetical protein